MGNKQETHVATTQQRPPTPIEVLKVDLAGDPMKTVTSYYGNNKEEAQRFMAAAIQYVRKVPKLLDCKRDSLVMAFVTAAQFRFLPSAASGEAFIIPYKDEAKFQLGYQGLVTLLYRTNQVVGITANIIYKNDHFEYEEGLDAKLVHRPAMFGKPAGEPIGVYTVAQMAGGAKTFKVMDKDAIMGIKALSKAKNSEQSPWNSDQDPELWMWKKTCLIQHSKLLPKSAELQQAIEKDYEGSGLDKRTPLDPAGPAVGASSHAPIAQVVPDEETRDPEKCKAGKHHIDYEDEHGNCVKCAKENKE